MSEFRLQSKMSQGESNGHHSLNTKEVICIKMLFKLGFNNTYISQHYPQVQRQTIALIGKERLWKSIIV